MEQQKYIYGGNHSINVLKEFSDNNEIYIRYNGFLTFLLTFAYINYKINENIDYITEHSIVDKGETPTIEETPTSDTEATSDKTPGGTEEKLQKLADMKEKGLINEEDYNNKKEEILNDMQILVQPKISDQKKNC